MLLSTYENETFYFYNPRFWSFLRPFALLTHAEFLVYLQKQNGICQSTFAILLIQDKSERWELIVKKWFLAHKDWESGR